MVRTCEWRGDCMSGRQPRVASRGPECAAHWRGPVRMGEETAHILRRRNGLCTVPAPMGKRLLSWFGATASIDFKLCKAKPTHTAAMERGGLMLPGTIVLSAARAPLARLARDHCDELHSAA